MAGWSAVVGTFLLAGVVLQLCLSPALRPGRTPVAGGADPVDLASVHQVRATVGGAVDFRGYAEHGCVHPPLGHFGTVAFAPELDVPRLS
ncbi:hypothetical protein [Mycobacterium leprae]|nr:hypothetical protein [Mycobacterium leprae]